MNVTYLIGNGFDINLGLSTRYIDFFEQYKTIKQDDSDEIKELKKSINRYLDAKNLDDLGTINWSNAELAFGQFTAHFSNDDNGDQAISNCHTDFCIALSKYLINEENRFDLDSIQKDKKLMQNIWKGFLDVTKGLRPNDRDKIKKYISTLSGGISLAIIDFNYTEIVDKIIACLAQEGIQGNRTFNNINYNNSINPIIHVHGTTTHGMAFGVNDDSQLGQDIFSDSEPERKWQLIKPLFNENMGENIDEMTWNAINASQIIYVYGMSIGVTDKRWWEKILKHLKDYDKAILMIQQYSFPTITLSPMKYVREQRLFRKMFMGYGEDLDPNQVNSIQERIFLTGENIFSCLADFVNNESKKNV